MYSRREPIEGTSTFENVGSSQPTKSEKMWLKMDKKKKGGRVFSN